MFQTASVTNSVGAGFAKGADTCSLTTRNPGETCTITINFTGPVGFSLRVGQLSVPYTGAGGSPVSLNLTGN